MVDFCHDSAKLMQASLALAAPKVELYDYHCFPSPSLWEGWDGLLILP
jgi:hypothetical protein